MSASVGDLFVRGAVLGFSIAAPVGPIGVLCIRRTLAEGRASGFVTGLGAATADTVYGLIAASGLSWLALSLVSHQTSIRIVGGVLLIVLGLRTLASRPAGEPALVEAPNARGLASNWATTFVLTIANPMTILSFAAAFAALGLGEAAQGPSGAALMVLGVFLGSAAWWLLLSGTVSTVRHKFDTRTLAWVNRASGVILVAFGVLALFHHSPPPTEGPV
jgi:threonine/homoserine/homoserine lactone efflux protein